VNTRRTSTKADSLIRLGTTRHTSRRASKRSLFRAKVATIVMSVVLFFGSLASIAIYNPAVDYEAPVPVQAQQITIVKPNGSDSIVLAPQPRVNAVRPFVRSRGS
jgi:hypothetical protein